MASTLTSISKVTSSGSQYSVSISDVVTVPNPTPLSEALDSEVVDPPPEMDFIAITKVLATIAEDQNEADEEAKYPAPPLNTPVQPSPATSIVHRPHARIRGMSTIADRLARSMAEGRKFTEHDFDATSLSGRSIRSSVPASDSSDGGFSDMLSDGGKGKHDSE